MNRVKREDYGSFVEYKRAVDNYLYWLEQEKLHVSMQLKEASIAYDKNLVTIQQLKENGFVPLPRAGRIGTSWWMQIDCPTVVVKLTETTAELRLGECYSITSQATVQDIKNLLIALKIRVEV